MIKYQEFKYGEKVQIDKDYANSSIVMVISQTDPNRMFTKVKDETTGYTWETMTNRLTKLENSNENHI